jgi:hypothetical protein
MHEDGVKLLNLMFKAGETVCVSPNKYGWHSVPLEKAMVGKVTLVPPNPDHDIQSANSQDLTLVALNPIQGFRLDSNCTSYRNFLLELDTGEIDRQIEYIKNIDVPYSALVFSGGKSVHTLVSLDEDLPNETIYRKFAEWMLAIATIADQNTKNPSRSIRIPGAFREPGKRQELLEYRGPISIIEFVSWLNRHPGCMPKERKRREISEKPNLEDFPSWVANSLINGLDPTKGRNRQWFSIACEFALQGVSDYDTMDLLSTYFMPDRDFTQREWETTIRSAFSYIYERKQ